MIRGMASSVARKSTHTGSGSTDDASRLADATEVAPFLLARLGDRTFAIDPERELELLDVLHEIGIRGGNPDG